MYEDRTIEDKYLYNFSHREKRSFYRDQLKKQEELAKYEGKLVELINSDSPALFSNWEPRGNSALEIRYILNRLAANDPRDKALELAHMDEVDKVYALAPRIAYALRGNTFCEKVVLNGVGLTDEGMVPILDTLRHNKLSLLDIRDNNVTEETARKVDEILMDPRTQWKQVYLGRIRVSSGMAQCLRNYPNLVVEPIVPVVKELKGFAARLARYFRVFDRQRQG